MASLPRERVYSWTVGVLGWLYLALLAVSGSLHNPLTLVLFAAYATLAEIWPARLRAGTVSILTAFLIPSAALIGPAGTAVVLAVGSLSAGLVQRRPVSVAVFNGGQYALAAGAAALVAERLLHLPLMGGLHMPALVAYYVVFLICNHLLVDLYFLLAGFNWRTAAIDGIGLDLLQSVVTLPLGFGVIVAFMAYGWPGIFAISTPLVLLGYAFNLQASLRQRNRNLEVLYEFHGKFARAEDGPGILQELRSSLAAVYGNPVSFAALCEERNGVQFLPESDLSPLPDVLETVRNTGREMIFDSSRLAQQLSSTAQSGIVYPIMIRTGCYGLIGFAWPFELHFDTEDRHLFRAAVQLAAIACEKEQLLRETERLAATDPRLPGLYNYRYLIERLEQEVGRNRRDATQLALVYIDLDGFKQCNDRFGHLAGDEALREFANLLGAQTRTHDIAARYAGDEFVLLLPDSNAELAYNVAFRLRQETEEYRFLGAVVEGGVPLSFSFGVATDEAGARTARQLIDEADRAMYRDKHRGRQGLRR
ncbi:MAG: diguanylate cyclase [Thermaerobacter sp.]|nr:diguanylate cyclase [Thermaerobacter sp.]